MAKHLFVTLVTCFFLMGFGRSQSVDLQGTILDRYSARPVPQAQVNLAKLGLNAITDSSGRFHFVAVPTGARGDGTHPALRAQSGRVLVFRSTGPGIFSLRLIDPAGKPRYRADYALPVAGDWEVRLGGLPAGLYFAHVEGPAFHAAVKVVVLANAEGEGACFTVRPSPASALAKAAAVVDTLRVAKAGYRSAAFPVSDWVQSGLSFPVSDSTVSMGRLAGLSTSAGTLTPAFNSSTYAYRVSIPDTVNILRLTPDATPAKPYIRVNGALAPSGAPTDPLALLPGINTFTVDVMSQDSSASVSYQLQVHRIIKDTAKIASLILSTGTLVPAFDPNVLDYQVTLPPAAPSFMVTAQASPAGSRMVLGYGPLQPGVPSFPISILPATTTNITVFVLTDVPGDTVIRGYNLLVTRPYDPTQDPADAGIKSIVYTPSRSYIKPFNPDSTFEVSTLEPKDSVFDITITMNNASAALTVDGAPQESGTPKHVHLPYGRIQFLVETKSPDGAHSRYYYLIFYHPKPLPTAVVSGPDYTVAGFPTAYSATAASSSNCVGSITTVYRFDFGDGKIGYGSPASHAWAAPGSYPVTFQYSCYGFHNDSLIASSDWSLPFPVTVAPADTGGGKPVRKVSGYRPVSETWWPETTYVVTANAKFDSSAVLTIRPGTHVQIDTGVYLHVDAINAVGTAADSIRILGGELRVQWRGLSTFNSDGSYRAGPRFEYCSFPMSRIYVDFDLSTYGGYGVYLKNSRLPVITGTTYHSARGTYIEHCRVDRIDGLRLTNSKLVNSYLGIANIAADGSAPTEMRRCEVQSLEFPTDFTGMIIAGNTLRGVQAGSAGALSGNNILSMAATPMVRVAVNNVDLRGNYWGETVTAEMVAKGANANISVIKDIFDDVTLGKVDYSGWLTTPVAAALPDW